ncbi:YfjI family protein, partial [Raoultella planticola]|uniref:YfjI family protein n=2 Tax=Klebsiella/Raoultella group TaxID=2890311 RepID=UPI0035245955
MKDFPFSAFPELLRETIFDIEDITQSPPEMIASAVLSALSLGCQSLVNVKINDTIVSPVSLYSFVIAESGERKTTVDKLVFRPFHEHDRDVSLQYETQKKEHEVRAKIWNKKENALLKCIDKATMKGLCTVKLSGQLEGLYAEKPEPPKARRFIYNNTTPEALQFAMYTHSPHTGLITDEGANILNRQTMTDFGFINPIWDGGDFQVERKTTPSFTLRNGRITLLVMVQKAIFEGYLKRQGERARGSGFFARCFVLNIDENLSTQGQRLIRRQSGHQSGDLKYLNCFYHRMNELIEKSAIQHGTGNQTCLSFEPQAQEEWVRIHNKIERRLGPEGDYENSKDFASKMSNNAARVAALLSYWTVGECAIKKEYVENAWLLCEWYMQQALTLFGNEEDYYEALLLSWLRREYSRSWKNVVRYNDIRNAGPNVLRKGKLLDRVIDRLEKEEVIDIDYSKYGARKVYKGRHFDNNPFTKHAAYQ